MFNLKSKELKMEMKLAKRVSKERAKEIVSTSKELAKNVDDKKLAKQIIKTAKKCAKEVVKSTKEKVKSCEAIEQVKDVVDKEVMSLNIDKCVETIREKADQIIQEKRSKVPFFKRGIIFRKIKEMITLMFMEDDLSDKAIQFIEDMSFDNFCYAILNSIDYQKFSKNHIIDIMRKLVYGNEINVEACQN